MNRSAIISERINDWFYGRAYGTSPANTVCTIAELFEGNISEKGLRLNVGFKTFRNYLCDATCTMYKAAVEGKTVEGPKRIHNLPKGWTEDLEAIWCDFVHSRVLNDDFWNDFWYDIQDATWESQFPQYRTFIQAVLPIYIQRDLEILIAEELVVKNSDGIYTDVYDPENEYEDTYYDDRD